MFMKRILLSAALLAGAFGLAQAVNITGVDQANQNRVSSIGFLRMSVTDTITAFAGGGQTSAVLLNSAYNRVTVVGSAGDSVKLPPCQTAPASSVGGGLPNNTLGLIMYVTNADSADSMNVFPSTGGSINALSANSAYAVAANKTVAFLCSPGGTIWYSLLGG